MKHLKITVHQTGMTAQSAFALNLAALLTHAGAVVTVEQSSGKHYSPDRLKNLLPTEPATPDTEVLILLEGQ